MKDIATVLRDFRADHTRFSAYDLKLRLRALVSDHHESDHSRHAANQIIASLGEGTVIDPYQLGLHANDVGFAQQIERLGKFLDDGDNVMRGGSRIVRRPRKRTLLRRTPGITTGHS